MRNLVIFVLKSLTYWAPLHIWHNKWQSCSKGIMYSRNKKDTSVVSFVNVKGEPHKTWDSKIQRNDRRHAHVTSGVRLSHFLSFLRIWHASFFRKMCRRPKKRLFDLAGLKFRRKERYPLALHTGIVGLDSVEDSDTTWEARLPVSVHQNIQPLQPSL